MSKELSRLGRKTFACQADARQAVETFAAEHLGKHHRLVADSSQKIVEVARYGKRGRPAKGAVPKEIR